MPTKSLHDDVLLPVRSAELFREVDRLRVRGACFLAQAAPDAAHQMHDRFPLSMDRALPHRDLPLVADHLDAIRWTNECALRAPDAVFVRDLNPTAKSLRDRDPFLGIPLRRRAPEEVPGHLGQ